MVMAYFMLIVDFSYALQAVMNIIMIFYWIIIFLNLPYYTLQFYCFPSFFIKKNLLELATCKIVIT